MDTDGAQDLLDGHSKIWHSNDQQLSKSATPKSKVVKSQLIQSATPTNKSAIPKSSKPSLQEHP
jgi:hypothetical protein